MRHARGPAPSDERQTPRHAPNRRRVVVAVAVGAALLLAAWGFCRPPERLTEEEGRAIDVALSEVRSPLLSRRDGRSGFGLSRSDRALLVYTHANWVPPKVPPSQYLAACNMVTDALDGLTGRLRGFPVWLVSPSAASSGEFYVHAHGRPGRPCAIVEDDTGWQYRIPDDYLDANGPLSYYLWSCLMQVRRGP